MKTAQMPISTAQILSHGALKNETILDHFGPSKVWGAGSAKFTAYNVHYLKNGSGTNYEIYGTI